MIRIKFSDSSLNEAVITSKFINSNMFLMIWIWYFSFRKVVNLLHLPIALLRVCNKKEWWKNVSWQIWRIFSETFYLNFYLWLISMTIFENFELMRLSLKKELFENESEYLWLLTAWIWIIFDQWSKIIQFWFC